MRRALPFHPVLIASFPILSLYSANLGMFNSADLWQPLGVAVGMTIIAWALTAFLWRDIERGAMGASALVVCTILYGQVFHAPAGALTLVAWGTFAICAVALVSWKLKGTAILNVLGFFLIVSSVGSIIYRTVNAPTPDRARRLPIQGRSADVHSPDVYYIILDGYGREDSLKQFIQFSNDDFLAQLKKRGFFIADRSHSNYVQTEISIPSSLNLNFIPTILPSVPNWETHRTSLDHLMRDNEASRQFKARGYSTSIVTSGFPPFDRLPADEEFHEKPDKTLFESTLSQSSPLASKRSDDAMYAQRREELVNAFDALRAMGGRRSTPRFVFAHILAPHPPFVFDAAGRPIRPTYTFGIWDGSDFVGAGATREEYRKGYSGQVQTVNREILKAIDAILAKPGVRPIIILQGDHGSKRYLDQNVLAKTDVRECFSNLFALLAPPEVQKLAYPSITPVNELRIVLNGLFDAKLPLLSDQSWYSPYAKPFFFTDVTQEVVEYANGVPSEVSKPSPSN